MTVHAGIVSALVGFLALRFIILLINRRTVVKDINHEIDNILHIDLCLDLSQAVAKLALRCMCSLVRHRA